MLPAMQAMFVLYALLGVAIARSCTAACRAATPRPTAPPRRSGRRRRIVYTLAALFSLDAFGGGFVVQSLLALWLYQRFGLSLATAARSSSGPACSSAVSYLVAVRIAQRIGLVNTMVFTHLPSSLCLVAVPFAPSCGSPSRCCCVRSALSQMDVPTRSSYVMAIVEPRRAPGRGEHHVGAAQPRIGGEPALAG